MSLFGLAVVGQAGTSVVEGVDKCERHRAGDASAEDVLAKLLNIARILRGVEDRLDGVLEGEVEGLCGEVPKNVGQVTTPERDETLPGHGSPSAVQDTIVGFVQDALLQHLVLVLHEELDTLDGCGGGLGHAGGHSGEHEALEETQSRLLLVRHFVSCPVDRTEMGESRSK